jgi:hypothetical protein
MHSWQEPEAQTLQGLWHSTLQSGPLHPLKQLQTPLLQQPFPLQAFKQGELSQSFDLEGQFRDPVVETDAGTLIKPPTSVVPSLRHFTSKQLAPPFCEDDVVPSTKLCSKHLLVGP